MTSRTGEHDLSLGAELGEAILCLQGGALDAALSRIVRTALASPEGGYVREAPDFGGRPQLVRSVLPDTFYALSGKKDGYGEQDRERLTMLADLTVRLFATKAELGKRLNESTQVQLQQQSQILDHMQESVITMDLAGFIVSWNRGAEKLFGYAASEAIGKNILFLYDDEELDGLKLFDMFLEQGGREMEVRRRKKSGEIFWASLTLSPLCDSQQEPIGIIGYLRDITERKQAEERINHLAYYDLLTGLPNRMLFKKLVDKALAQFQRNSSLGSLLFIDLDRFKPINDTLGHHIGDALLKQVAERLRRTLRDNDVVARLGSDEFAIVLQEINQHYHAGLVAQKLLAALDQEFIIEGHELRIGASIGISVYPQDGQDADNLIRRADIAMFKAKRSGEGVGGTYVFYNQEMNHTIAGRLHLESALRRALERKEFSLLYQPKIDIATGRIIGAEALLRWQHPEKGMISPVDFIPVAEETGLIQQIDAWVLETACAQARKWRDLGQDSFRVAVNVSAKEFTTSLPDRVGKVLTRHDIAPQWLELEITESMLMNSAQGVLAIMDEITALGVVLSLDDFGTGYSSLSYLKRFPIDTLKIDRSFIQGIPEDVNDCAIASAIISMAKQLKHKVIAEGVENPEQLSFLKNAGCDEVQGYMFSHPISAAKFEEMLVTDHRFAL